MTKQNQEKLRAEAYDRKAKLAFDKKFMVSDEKVTDMLSDIINSLKIQK